MVLKSYTSSYQSSSTTSGDSRSTRSRPSTRSSASTGLGDGSYPRSKSSSTTYQSSTSYESYVPKVRSISNYDSTYKASEYTPGSYTAKKYGGSSKTYSSDLPKYSQDDSVNVSRYSSYNRSTAAAPRRRYSLSVDHDIGRSVAAERGYNRGASVDRGGDSFVLGYASVKTRSGPDEPIPHATINAPEIGHARVHITTETRSKAPEPPIVHVSSTALGSSYKAPSVPVQPSRPEKPRGSVAGFSYKPPAAPVHSSIPAKPLPRRDYDFSYNTYGFELGEGHERLDVDELPGRERPRKRASSTSRNFITPIQPEGSRVRSRAASLSRFPRYELDDEESVILPRRRSASVSRYHGVDHEVALPVARYGRSDLGHIVTHPGSAYSPDQISTTILPSGQRALTYEHVSQRGKGDHKEANTRIEEIIHRTRHLQESMHTLEDFVKRNRSLFPEEVLVYQHIEFYQLNEAQLKKIGAKPDAVVYGIKVRERLVVPYGTDVTHLLQKYYQGNKSDYAVEYSDRDKIKKGIVQQNDEGLSMKDRIRKQVEEEWDLERQRRLLGLNQRSEVKEANKQSVKHDNYKHMHPHVTDDFLRSFYVNAGLDYDSIYSQRSVGSALPSEQESTITKSSVSSSRKKRLDAQPQFMSRLRSKRAADGQTIRFNCSVQGLPVPDITWLKGNRIIEDGGKYRISNNYGLLSLEISNVTKEDEGLYTVKATNQEGEIACSAPLEVQEMAPEQEKLGLMKKPYFLVDIPNLVCEIGQKAVFEAQATGKPMPSFRWQKEGLNISQDDKYKVFSDERGNSKLIIKNVITSDMGLYFCLAENREGKAKTAASLRVVDKGELIHGERPAAIRRRSMSREATPVFDKHAVSTVPPIGGGAKPYFVQVPPTEMAAVAGDPLMMRCIVDGDPKPVVKWFKGARELNYTNRHRVLVEGDHHIMQIRALLQTDPGEYSIVAENSVGRVKTNVWLNVTPRPEGQDEDFDESRARMEFPEFDQYELDITREQGKMAPRFVKRLPLEQEVKEGESLQIGCKIDEVQLPDAVTVELNVISKEPASPEEAVSEQKTEATPAAVEEVAEAVAEPVADTAAVEEIAEAVAESVVNTAVVEAAATAKGDAPKIITPLEDKEVKAGGIIKLTIIIDSPSATVKWFKNDKDVTDDGQYEMYAEEDSYNLEVSDVELSHSGVYSVVVSNNHGSVSSECRVTVQESSVETTIEQTTELQQEQTEEFEVTLTSDASTEVLESSTDIKIVLTEETQEDIKVTPSTEVSVEPIVESPIDIQITPAEESQAEIEVTETSEVTDEESKVQVESEVIVQATEVETATEDNVVAEVTAEAEVSMEISIDTETKVEEAVNEETTEAVISLEAEIPSVEEVQEEKAPVAEEVQEENTPVAEEVQEEKTPVAEEAQVEKTPVAEEVKEEKTPVAEEVQEEKTPVAEEAQEEETPVAEEVQEEKTPVVEKKKKKKKKDEDASGESTVEEKVVEGEKKKKKKKDEKSDEDQSTSEDSKKKKKKVEGKTEEAASGTEGTAKEEKKKKKKKGKSEEPSEDDAGKEEDTKEKKKKKKSKEEHVDSGEKSPDETTKEEKKKKKSKKDKKAVEEQVDVEIASVVESSNISETSQSTTVEVLAEATTADEVSTSNVVEGETEQTITISESADADLTLSASDMKGDVITLEGEQTSEMTTETITISSAVEDVVVSVEDVTGESEVGKSDLDMIGKGEFASIDESSMESTFVIESESGAQATSEMDASQEMTITLGGDVTTSAAGGDTVFESRTVTQERVVEMVEGGEEYTEAEFALDAGSAPVLETPLRGCVVNVGETARLECKIHCEEKLQITWTKDGLDLSDTDLLKLSTEADSVFALIISSAQKSDEGDYTIIASSSGGTIQLTANIIIVESMDSEEEESEDESGSDEEDVSEVGKGDNVPVDDSSTEMTITLGGDVTTSAGGDTVFESRTVTQERVVEMVEGGEEYTEAEFALDAGSAPVLETPLRGCVVNVGETARLECKINCDEAPQVEWNKDGNTLSDQDGLRLSTEADGVFALIISSAQKSDEGDYTIIVSTSGGTIQLTANIIVIEKSEGSEEESEEEGSESEEEKEEEEKDEAGDEEGSDRSDKDSEENSEDSSEADSDDNSEDEEQCDQIVCEPSDAETFIESKDMHTSRLGGLFTQAIKIGEYLMRDYIM